MDDIHKNIEECNPNKNFLVVFDNMTADVVSNKT